MNPTVARVVNCQRCVSSLACKMIFLFDEASAAGTYCSWPFVRFNTATTVSVVQSCCCCTRLPARGCRFGGQPCHDIPWVHATALLHPCASMQERTDLTVPCRCDDVFGSLSLHLSCTHQQLCLSLSCSSCLRFTFISCAY